MRLEAGGDVDTRIVDGDGDQGGAGAEQGTTGAEIARFFKPHLVAGVDEQAGDEVDGLLRTGDDEYLVGMAADGAGGAEIAGNGLPQRPITRWIGIEQHVVCGAAPVARQEA